ncbi:hypothetical protein [Arthrobacter sp. SLBN-53]|uniref:hypothetical protein n=1 Tax=Arthrobacter sp. SLBN-53 TaxID=2768412 RepID=UPI001153DE63|nr:hypothetical protein [Arthrobacter sp. SLBN-53]TQK27893.1 hypothetical protein FBY28_0855 [Arthrobacter sp. SLBN-53]
MTVTQDVDGRRKTCTSWCVADHAADPACWGEDIHKVHLTTEYWDSAEDNSITPYAHRSTPAHRELVKLHFYRPSDREHMYLDADMHLTADEARQLAAHLVAVADQIEEAGK